jgi:hypothetical protein
MCRHQLLANALGEGHYFRFFDVFFAGKVVVKVEVL